MDTAGENESSLEPQWSWTKWCNSSPEALREAEDSIISVLDRAQEFYGHYVKVSEDVHIWTQELKSRQVRQEQVPLVIVHGMGAGLGVYAANAELLAENRKVILIDLPGFARSSRPEFSTNPLECEKEYTSYLESWRKKMELREMYLMGHSFGGFIAASYALSYPGIVKHLLLIDPWGMPVPPKAQGLAKVIEVVLDLSRNFTPLLGLRVGGVFGLNAVRWFKSNLMKSWMKTFKTDDDKLLPDYIYHCNTQKPTGEVAFITLSEMFIWAKRPLILRLNELHSSIPLSVIFGEYSWILKLGIEGLEESRIKENFYTSLSIVPQGSHHLFLDYPLKFTEIVIAAITNTDQKLKRGLAKKHSESN